MDDFNLEWNNKWSSLDSMDSDNSDSSDSNTPLSVYKQLVRRMNDDRRTSGGTPQADFNSTNMLCYYSVRGNFDPPGNQMLYDKVPSYMSAFSSSNIHPRPQSQILHDVILNLSANDNETMRPISPPPFHSTASLSNKASNHSSKLNSQREYSRLPAYATDISESMRWDEDFSPPTVNILSSDKQTVTLPVKTKKNKIKFERGSLEEIESRCILFIGKIPRCWNKHAREQLAKIIKDGGLKRPKKIQVKSRFRCALDSYAFIYFHKPADAHQAYDYFQNHAEYSQMNVSFGGRDLYMQGKEYMDRDGLPTTLHSLGGAALSVNPPSRILYHPGDNQKKVTAGSVGRTALDYSDLLVEHMQCQENRD